MARMNWDRARKREVVGARGQVRSVDEARFKPKSRKRSPGITPAQAKYLAKLQRQLGHVYTGNGMRKDEASQAISDCLSRLQAKCRGCGVHVGSIHKRWCSVSAGTVMRDDCEER